MATRATARVYDDDGAEVILTIYKHWDGYPEGFGETLNSIANRYTLVNGLNSNDTTGLANGMGCFAASLIKELKREAGDVYIIREGREEYNYRLKADGNKIIVTCDEVE